MGNQVFNLIFSVAGPSHFVPSEPYYIFFIINSIFFVLFAQLYMCFRSLLDMAIL